jgi:hypothetical protein
MKITMVWNATNNNYTAATELLPVAILIATNEA